MKGAIPDHSDARRFIKYINRRNAELSIRDVALPDFARVVTRSFHVSLVDSSARGSKK